MRKKIVTICLCLGLGLAFMNLLMLSQTTVGEVNALPDYIPMRAEESVREANYKIPKGPFNIEDTTNSEENSESMEMEASAIVGEIRTWLAMDDYYGGYYFTDYELRATSETTEIWVQLDLSWPEGDSRTYPIITEEQVNYMLEEFDTNIYPTDTEYFGIPDDHYGSESLLESWGYVPPGYYQDDAGRSVVLVSNIMDENYYDEEYPYYIIGFYSPSYELYFDRNIITIDCYNWEDRVGPDVPRPFTYEATVAHEFQHLIHDDYNTYDATFMNEGCSMFAEVICGYPIPWGDINSYLFTPDNSLTVWGDQGGINILADYGQALLWTLYLSDHYGGADFIKHFVQQGIAGIEGINMALIDFGFTTDFYEIYHDWRIANLIHSDNPGDGLYNYKTIDLGSEDAISATIHEIMEHHIVDYRGTDFGTTFTILDYDTGIATIDAFGSDYIKLNNLKGNKIPFLIFDGDDRAEVPTWVREDMDEDGDLEWYSTAAGSEAELLLFSEVDLTGLITAMLTFDTYFEIEPLWDFGFVQVSTDGGETWISLENEYTTQDHDPNAYPAIIDSLPGLTGYLDDWMEMSFDLTPFVGQSIMIGFRYMTDWGTEEPGWWIDNIKLNEILIDNADDLIVFGFPPMPELDFMVTVIGVDEKTDSLKYKFVRDLLLLDTWEWGIMNLQPYSRRDFMYIIISPKQGPADYQFSIMYLKHCWCI